MCFRNVTILQTVLLPKLLDTITPHSTQLSMRKFVLASALLVSTVTAQQKQSSSQSLPPLIDRQLLFGNPEIAGAQISPAGTSIAFLKPSKSLLNPSVTQ